ncbi:hypothetical protein L228DRAFT_266898 [Xylona heveae TC161]|uniref:Uncharacterized protein n=1 Tax=Xylona heveae (strain CBS 132557 / TC161) TaxID=1328760 RepID=A0A165I999_XYLHT|nr:hypothetical protein L228DRAFT_266898 [Xylona heveae TC161]KZF24574.1 hypothetical protein L228DRAFT_266898 [Xylona heveae TC161]
MEEDVPPSYEAATSRDVWAIVAPYARLSKNDLCAACLVSSHWYHTFVRYLWGNPASHFGVDDDAVYAALTRFRRTLFSARLNVRSLTHTLQLPPARGELYGGPKAEWLRDLLEMLPNLQSLLVSGLPFFDHAAIQLIGDFSSGRRPTNDDESPNYPLRLLDASGCKNATSHNLSLALPHFPNLLYLDLSRTSAANNSLVLDSLSSLPFLRILKLQRCGLRDEHVEVLASALKTSIRSLDLTGNYLTDRSAISLLSHCFCSPRSYDYATTRSRHRAVSLIDEDWPAGMYPYAAGPLPAAYNSEELEGHVAGWLTREFIGRLSFEDVPPNGITHLYISNNSFTPSGLRQLLKTKRLKVLDCASMAKRSGPTSPHHLFPPNDPRLHGSELRIENLAPTLYRFCHDKLTYLRVDYQIATEPTSIDEGADREPYAVTPPAVELDASVTVPELDATNVFYELSTGEEIAELPSDCVTSPSQPATIERSTLIPEPEETPESRVRRSSIFAPETCDPDHNFRDMEPQRCAPVSELGSNKADNDLKSLHDSTTRILRRRQNSQPGGLRPAMLPKLRTLVLTSVPSKTRDQKVIGALLEFIRQCAEEEGLAMLQATVEQVNFSFLTAREREQFKQNRAHDIFALRKLVLGIGSSNNAWRSQNYGLHHDTKSSTEDPDSEAFWEAAEGDFSFFDDEECGVPVREQRHSLPSAFATEKIALGSSEAEDAPIATTIPEFDVVSELARFRRESKAAFAHAHARGRPYSELLLLGHWSGEIQVIQQDLTAIRRRWNTDWYGNVFEGAIYR